MTDRVQRVPPPYLSPPYDHAVYASTYKTGTFKHIVSRRQAQIFNNWCCLGKRPMRTNTGPGAEWALEPLHPRAGRYPQQLVQGRRSARVPGRAWVTGAGWVVLQGALGIDLYWLEWEHGHTFARTLPYCCVLAACSRPHFVAFFPGHSEEDTTFSF